jgi:hypothetical protein
MVNADGGVFYFAAKITNSALYNMFMNSPTSANGFIEVRDDGGTPKVRAYFGTGGAGNTTTGGQAPVAGAANTGNGGGGGRNVTGETGGTAGGTGIVVIRYKI